MAGQPTIITPPRNKGLIRPLLRETQWLISPYHKAGSFSGGGMLGGVGGLTSHK